MANIYLNEFDRFVVHQLKPLAYMRYGDDFLCFTGLEPQIKKVRWQAGLFLKQRLGLEINPSVDITQPVYKGISYLGVDVWPSGRRLQPRVRAHVTARLNRRNSASYRALVSAHEPPKYRKMFDWRLSELDDQP